MRKRRTLALFIGSFLCVFIKFSMISYSGELASLYEEVMLSFEEIEKCTVDAIKNYEKGKLDIAISQVRKARENHYQTSNLLLQMKKSLRDTTNVDITEANELTTELNGILEESAKSIERLMDSFIEVRKLTEPGANVNVMNVYGTTPLFRASRDGGTVLVNLLLKAKADVNKARRKDGATPLYIASQNGHSEVVKLLLIFGADVNKARTIEYTKGSTPLYIAQRNGNTEVVKLLKRYGAKE